MSKIFSMAEAFTTIQESAMSISTIHKQHAVDDARFDLFTPDFRERFLTQLMKMLAQMAVR